MERLLRSHAPLNDQLVGTAHPARVFKCRARLFSLAVFGIEHYKKDATLKGCPTKDEIFIYEVFY